jgi:SAM-dependent methyltransferase
VNDGIHDAAASGFGAAAEEYERSRPDYPDEAIDRLVQEMEIMPEGLLLDLGAGTGKLTRMLLSTRARLVAVEPVLEMRRVFSRVVPDVPLVGATAEALPFRDASFDGVIVGQAFHWFRGDEALAEIARVLKAAGRLGLLWNVWDRSSELVQRLNDIIEPYESVAPRERTTRWREPFARSDDFGSLNQRRFQHQQRFDIDGLVIRVASISFIARLEPEERSRVLDQVRETGESIASDGEILLPYVTDLYWCSRM